MATKIGIRCIESMPTQTILWDSIVRGFHARRQYGSGVTFSVFYRNAEGGQRWHRIGRHGVFSPDQARKEAARILREVALGNDPTAERTALRNSITVAQLCDEYVAEMQSSGTKKASTIKSDISRIGAQIKPKLGQRKVTAVTQSDAEELMRGMSAGGARRNIGLLGAIFSYAVKRKLRPDNPAHGLDKPSDVKRMRRLSEAEYKALHKALDGEGSTANDVILLLAVTGWRSGEAKNLRWSEVDLERHTAVLGDTKTGQSVRPLSGAAIEIIKRQSAKGEYVFEHRRAKPISNLTPWWNKLGTPDDVTPHTLRHSFASLAADLGLPDHQIAGLGITSRYMHLGDKALLDASDLVANETVRLMQRS